VLGQLTLEPKNQLGPLVAFVNGLVLGRSDFRFSIILDILYNFFHTFTGIFALSVFFSFYQEKKYRVSQKLCFLSLLCTGKFKNRFSLLLLIAE
jgi:TctA family transporter